MTTEISNTILLLVGVITVAIQFWTAKKPVETKLVILRWLVEISCIVATVAAVYFLMTSDNITPPFACAFYNFLVQVALFTLSPLPTARREILSLVTAAVFVATIPTYTATRVLAKSTIALAKAQSQLAQNQSRMLDVQEGAAKLEVNVLASLKRLVDVLPTTSPSPTPSPSPSPTPK